VDPHLIATPGIDRRTFLRASAAGTAGLALGLMRLRPALAAPAAAAAAPAAYGDWRDIYRQRWAWDRVVRSSHFVNCWYQAHCAWDVYVKDGLVWREEQAADYPQSPGLEPARLPEGRLLQRADVRPCAPAVPAEARRRTRLRKVAAHLVGGGARRDRGFGARHGYRRGKRSGDLGPRPALHDGHHGRGAPAALAAARLDQPRHEHGDRRRASGRGGDLRQDRLRALGRRLLLLRPDPDLGGEPGLHADSERALPARSALQGRPARLHRAGLQPFGDARRHLGSGEAGLRCRAGSRDRARAHRRRALRARVRGGADRPAASRARGHAPLPAHLGSRGGGERRAALPPRCGARDRARPAPEPRARGAPALPRGALRGDASRRAARRRPSGLRRASRSPGGV
jgi:hypothetical protein